MWQLGIHIRLAVAYANWLTQLDAGQSDIPDSQNLALSRVRMTAIFMNNKGLIQQDASGLYSWSNDSPPPIDEVNFINLISELDVKFRENNLQG